MFVFVPQSYRDKKKGLWKCSRSGGPLAPTQLDARNAAAQRQSRCNSTVWAGVSHLFPGSQEIFIRADRWPESDVQP
jgi:hypothetical protein